ncbi:MAG: DUF2066 domain-containing protein [Alphaproteobacteria bacterium]|nr:DUF2066 domain-containing protein [Alphaproteobacteria bacterium]
MALRLMTVIARAQSFRTKWCALLLAGMLASSAAPASAEDTDDSYSATVKVDATAETAGAAREAARVDGQRRALVAVIERLSGSTENSKLPKLDDKAITDMVASFEVANERMSAVRYVADFTFHFRPPKIRRLVRVTESTPAEGGSKGSTDGGGKSATEGGSKPAVESGNRAVVVLPVYQDGSNVVLWDDPNAWRAAWSQRQSGSGPGRLVLPLGDAGDLAAIDAEKAGSGKSEALAAIAQRNRGSEAVVALATARRQGDKVAGLDVSVKRYRYGHLVDTLAKSFEAAPGESEADFLKRAAEATAADIETGAKRNEGGPASLAVSVPITSLGEWLQVRDRLASVSIIRKIDLLSLSRQEARIEVKYVGSQDQLKSSLAEANLDLGGGDPVWRIQPSDAASAR